MKTFLDWSAYKDAGMGDAYADIPTHGGNFAKAVSVCINARQCEQVLDKRVMCPAFRVTENKLLSTGGRVRLLKAALNADSPEHALSDQEVAEAMEDCIACKGCKRECENNVDMALIKSEYLAQKAQLEGFSLRSRLFANGPTLIANSVLARLLVAFKNRFFLAAYATEKLLGIDRKAKLPEPSEQAFKVPKQIKVEISELPEVVLFIDTFARHYNPEIAYAAIEVLDAAGYQVHVATPYAGDSKPEQPLCCGRTYLAQGMIKEARLQARRLVNALLPHLQANRIIVGLEPSCILGLRDDFQALNLDKFEQDENYLERIDYAEIAQEIGKRAFLFEEFLAKEMMAKRLNLPLKQAKDWPDLLVHGHCHQKAVGAMKSMRKVLKLVPNLNFEFIDSGCCGMAGTYGLESEHKQKSDMMVNERLIPALENAPDNPIVANGFSCRHQIKQHTGREARHIAQVIRDRLKIPSCEA